MSSSAKIFKSLSASTLPRQQNEDKFLINVPQKCYAFITPETDRSIHGLYTSGLNTCSGIVILAHDESHRYFFLCHADSHTDLSDKLHGLPAWLKKIPTSINKVEIQFDDIDSMYSDSLNDIVNKINSEEKAHNIIITPIENSSTDIAIKRTGEVIREGGIHFDLLDNGYKSIESNIEENISDLVNFSEIANGPICVFNGEKILNKDQIIRSQPWVGDILETAEYTNQQLTEFEDSHNDKARPSLNF